MWARRFALLFLFLIGMASLTREAAGRADERIAVPPPIDVVKAEGLIRSLFKAEYAKTKAADRSALAAKLMEQYAETKDDQAARYVLLRDARDIAAKAGDADMALKAAHELAATFLVEPSESLTAVAEFLVASTATNATTATDALLVACDEARGKDDWKGAYALAKAAEILSRRSKDPSHPPIAKAKLKEVELIKSDAEKVKLHLETLKVKPDDPGANLAVGRFLCFGKHDWEAGTKYLTKAPDEKLKDAAEKEIKAATGSDADKLAAADAWFELGSKADGLTKSGMLLRALHWYNAAVTDLTGLNKTRVEKRIQELKTTVESRLEKGKWAIVRRAIAEKELKQGDIIGGAFAKDTFEEVPKDGAILIGFNYATISNGRYPGLVQPIFMTPRGEMRGRIYVNPAEKRLGPIQTAKAKPGYAVGAIYTRGGGGIDAFKPIFMKMTEKGLNPSDKYDGPHIGGNGGGEGTVGGDGNFIVGIHGKIDARGVIMAISVVSVSSDGAKKKP